MDLEMFCLFRRGAPGLGSEKTAPAAHRDNPSQSAPPGIPSTTELHVFLPWPRFCEQNWKMVSGPEAKNRRTRKSEGQAWPRIRWKPDDTLVSEKKIN